VSKSAEASVVPGHGRDACSAYKADMRAGDILFIPSCWWHQVNHHGDFNVNVTYWFPPQQSGNRGECDGIRKPPSSELSFQIMRLLVINLSAAIVGILRARILQLHRTSKRRLLRILPWTSS